MIGASLLTQLFVASEANPQTVPYPVKNVCWIEYASGQAPGSMGAAGAELKLWHTTVSGILIRRRQGDVLIDAGFSAKVEAQMRELAPQKQPIAQMILGAYTFRRSTPEALAAAGETLDRVTTIIPTHAHYDHLAGAEDLPDARILMAPEDIKFLEREQQAPDIVAASNIVAVRSRIEPLSFTKVRYLGFAQSLDVFGDGSLIVVPLPGHTPGSIGVFLRVGERLVFAIGDATWIMEAINRDLPRPRAFRDFADNDPNGADHEVKVLAAFHAAHPEIMILPAHDRDAWKAIFGEPGCR